MPKTPPRERMIDAAITLMRRSGYSGAGINEVLAESGAPKGSMYHYFPDGKRQVAAEALDVYAQRVVAFIGEHLAGKGRVEARVKRLFEAFARRLEQFDFAQSCAVGCVSLDLDPHLEPVRERAAAAFAAYRAAIASHLGFDDTARAHSFAGLVLSAIEGAYVRGRAERSGAAFLEAGAWLAPLAGAQARR
jgi:TetR/AcrR family transcriptional repressor of lmrAB and yxaGH operons